MDIENQFDLPLPPAAAWPILMDVPRTAACFPGASHIEQTGTDQYKGRVTVKLGPLTMVFAGFTVACGLVMILCDRYLQGDKA